ncbi:terpenoid synthase [Exidia glandulosa HHB12029]|uniref:Terpene synthase n=1 Tax=Exidia glandulosa HHB12029 TaxID=1314781 RepID=A0A165FUK4_EXIGL|nr:terpenoid synthase [Exidia glandulosa HHB12029]
MNFSSLFDANDCAYYLPDTLADWPWPRHLNASHASAKAASDAWIKKFNAFSPKAQDSFDRCDFKQLRAACDMMQLCWVFDEYSDRENEDAIRHMADCIMLGIRRPQVPQNTTLGEIARQFGERVLTVLSPQNRERFIESFEDYTDAIVQRAQDRDRAYVRNVQDYFSVRRETIGTRPAFAFLLFDKTIPNEILEDPVMSQLQSLASDMIILGNDLYSYNKEQASGADGHNVITIVRKAYGWSLERALQWVDELHDDLARSFLDAVATVPSFGAEYDSNVRHFIDGVAQWVRANEAWSFESQRYFGACGLKVQKERRVVLMPRVDSESA